MQFSLRTLLILLGVAPPVIAWMLTSDPGVAVVVTAAAILVGYLCILDMVPRSAARRWAIRFPTRDAIPILGIAVVSHFAAFSLWWNNSLAVLVLTAVLFLFGCSCYGLGAYIHSRRHKHAPAAALVDANNCGDVLQPVGLREPLMRKQSCHAPSRDARPQC